MKVFCKTFLKFLQYLTKIFGNISKITRNFGRKLFGNFLKLIFFFFFFKFPTKLPNAIDVSGQKFYED